MHNRVGFFNIYIYIYVYIYIYMYHWPPKPTFLDVFLVNKLVFRWPKPLFFMVRISNRPWQAGLFSESLESLAYRQDSDDEAAKLRLSFWMFLECSDCFRGQEESLMLHMASSLNFMYVYIYIQLVHRYHTVPGF